MKAAATVGGMSPLALPRECFAAGCLLGEGSVRLRELPILGLSPWVLVFPGLPAADWLSQVLELVPQ